MEERLKEVLQGREGNYIVPFFWQHGESEETMREYMEQIYTSGIRAVCVESRPHPDYVGPGWWRDMDVILEEAAARKMRVWVLDDSHFPTGYCNGKIVSRPEYGKVFLDHYTIDVMGPDREASFLIRLQEGEELVGVVAVKCQGAPEEEAAMADITSHVKDGMVYWPVPHGYWRIVVLKTVREGGNCRKNYCNLLDRDAVAFFLDTVYEPHWQHYKEKFGNVFAGFFSDEPEFGNTFGEYPDSGIGQPTMVLPWCRELAKRCGEVWGEEKNLCLAALWSSLEGYTERARYGYMSMATELYSRNFCMQVGKWCEDHGVEYIGHVVEDNGNHARTGYGTGHFFKALWGQHMSGIDVVLQQIRPGYDDRDFYHIGGKNTYDGRFFHYGLGKMGSSLAHLDGKKTGRTICEVYGAYGWAEGLKLMKWIADHMLVRGVNWFVPHAFTPAPFPDRDCPPHFYAQGKNPQFPWFGDLMGYMNRLCHLFNGGNSVIHTAVLYTAEMSWMGDCMPFEEVGKWLMRGQIDFDVVPVWLLEESGFSEDGSRLRMGSASYSVLIIPDCVFIPEKLEKWLECAAQSGFPVLFAGRRPEVVRTGAEGIGCGEIKAEAEGIGCGEIKAKTEGIGCGEIRAKAEGIGCGEIKAKAEGIGCGEVKAKAEGIGCGEVKAKTEGIGCGEVKAKAEGMSSEEVKAEAEGRDSKVVKAKAERKSLEEMQSTGLQDILTDSIGAFCQGNRDTLFLRLEEIGVREIRTSGPQPWLRYHQYRQPEGMLYLFFNEHPTEWVDTWVEIKELHKVYSYAECCGETRDAVCRKADGSRLHDGGKSFYWYDAWDNCLYQTEQNAQGQFHLHLSPYETRVLYLSRGEKEKLSAGIRLFASPLNDLWEASGGKCVELTGMWQVSFKEYDEDRFCLPERWPSLENVTGKERRPEFSGTIRYEISFDWDPAAEGETAVLDCGEVYETLEVKLNGMKQAVRVAPPYTLLLKGLRKGKNDLELLVTNTLVHKMRDDLSATMPVEASGMVGPVRLRGTHQSLFHIPFFQYQDTDSAEQNEKQ